jgi:hypothetical protein
MILQNAKQRLLEASEKANIEETTQEVTFIYNELLTHDGILSVFEWLFRNSIDFGTRHDEFRFVVLVFPVNKK